jgi:hypothetical protein
VGAEHRFHQIREGLERKRFLIYRRCQLLMEYIFEGRWMKLEYEAIVKRYFYRRAEVLRENLPSATMSTANTTRSGRRSNPSLQGESPAIKGLSRDTALLQPPPPQVSLKLPARDWGNITRPFVFRWRASRDSSRSSTEFNSWSEIAAANFAGAKWCSVAKRPTTGPSGGLLHGCEGAFKFLNN